MDITLTLDEVTAARAVALAQERATTIAGLVTELLEQACQTGPGDEFVSLAREHSGSSEAGWRFDRDACHDRGGGDR